MQGIDYQNDLKLKLPRTKSPSPYLFQCTRNVSFFGRFNKII